MAAKLYRIAGREFVKLRDETPRRLDKKVHVVEGGVGFWHGDKGYNHLALCGQSVGGRPLGQYVAPNVKVNCGPCRREVERLKGRLR
jgi:hypothetical protein